MAPPVYPIEIPLNKRNLAFMLLGAAGFVLLGLVFLLLPGRFELFDGRIVLIRGVGLVAILFFGLMGYWIYRRYLDPKTGLRIDERGITDHSSGVSVGLIDWADIQAIETTRVATERFLVLFTDRPEKYTDRAPNAVVRSFMRGNERMVGSPLTIGARSLQISFEELEATVRAAWEHQQAGPATGR